MKNRANRRQTGKGAIELIEEAVHLLRAAPAAVLASYYLGAAPFVLGWLYFWADMSQSAFATQHLAGAALGLAALFFWMKFWQARFAGHLRALMAGQSPSPLTLRRGWRMFISQTALQPFGLFLLPSALVPVLPFPWVYAFYQNLTALAESETSGLVGLVKKSREQAALWPRQNVVLLLILTGFGFYVFLNWATVCYLLPSLVKQLFGVETMFARSGFGLLNTTFFAGMFGLTYLCVDPILKGVYAVRCFYGQSLQSGEDLKAELRLFSLPTGRAAALVFAVALAARSLDPAWKPPGFGVRQSSGAFFGFIDVTSGDRLAKSKAPEGWRIPKPWRAGISALQLTDAEVGGETPAATERSPATISPPVLDQAIEEVIQQTKYTWRMPREKLAEPESTQKGIIERFLERVGKTLRQWLRAMSDWLADWIKKLSHRQSRGERGAPGYTWMLWLQILLYAVIAAAVAALGILIYRLLRGRRRKAAALASEPIQPAPDLADDNVGPEQLPEDGWTRLARDLLERGEFRLALRAFYLASLAHLAGRNLISLAKFKSNRDYERELRRRGHSFPQLLALFGENVSVFDRIWYGLHDIHPELVSQFAANVERMKGCE